MSANAGAEMWIRPPDLARLAVARLPLDDSEPACALVQSNNCSTHSAHSPLARFVMSGSRSPERF
jgi:hypothetical protein